MARGHGRPAKKIDNLRWLGSIVAPFAAMGSGSQAFTVANAGVPRETIMRTRGQVIVAIDGTSAPGTMALISMGLVLVPEGQGTTVVWEPFNDAEAPWFWHYETFLGYEEMVTDVIDVPGITSDRVIVDSKAMRKANVDEEIQFVITNTVVIGGGEIINAAATFRFLLGN